MTTTQTTFARLETERLILRVWTQEDQPFLARYYADEESARFVGGALNPEQAWRRMAMLIGHFVLRGYGQWVVEARESGQPVGSVGLWLSEGWPELELGYWLTPEARGRGYAVEAGAAARDYAFGVLAADSLVSYVHPENQPSMTVAERLGAEREDLIDLLTYGPHWVYRYSNELGR